MNFCLELKRCDDNKTDGYKDFYLILYCCCFSVHPFVLDFSREYSFSHRNNLLTFHIYVIYSFVFWIKLCCIAPKLGIFGHFVAVIFCWKYIMVFCYRNDYTNSPDDPWPSFHVWRHQFWPKIGIIYTQLLREEEIFPIIPGSEWSV